MSKILITGGAGFIGSHLAEELTKQGHEITILDDLSTGKKENIKHIKTKFIKGNILNQKTLDKATKGQEYVFHMAALVSVQKSIEQPEKTHEINATGTLKVLMASKKAGIKKVIYSSTAATYGDEPTQPKTENSPTKPQTPYAITKLTGEYYATLYNDLYGLPTTTLRYFNVYGPRQDPTSQYSGVITKFIKILKEKKQPTIYGDGTQTRDFVYVKDVVEANIKAMKTTGTYNIATGQQTTINELLAHLNEILGTKTTPKHEPAKKGDIKHSLADITLAKQKLGYKPTTTLHEGLKETIESQ